MTPLIVLINPACGSGNGREFVHEHVLPLLKATPLASILETERPDHAGELVLDFLKARQINAVTVVVASGDGTIHEIINTVQELAGRVYEIDFVLVPVGTANALFASLFALCPNRDTASPSYKLQSMHAYLSRAVARPLTIMTTRTYTDNLDSPRKMIRSAVVTSTALHASILHDSEALRAEHPSIERFKIAAQQNITRWYSASVKLLPLLKDDPSGTDLLEYSVTNSAFVPFHSSPTLDGPFSYLVSTANVDRLEPEFCIAPLQSRFPSPSPFLDVVLIRPQRDLSLKHAARPKETYAAKLGDMFKSAYTAGAHVDLVYDGQDGVSIWKEGNEGTTMVEYYRCGGWEWIPDKSDSAAHLVCADGTILQLEAGETARCTISQPLEDEPRFAVFGR